MLVGIRSSLRHLCSTLHLAVESVLHYGSFSQSEKKRVGSSPFSITFCSYKMSTPVAFRGFSAIINQPFQGKTGKVHAKVSTIREASCFSSPHGTLDSVSSFSTLENCRASFVPHRSNPGRSRQLYQSPVRTNSKSITNAEFLTLPGRQRTDNLSSRRILPRSSSIGSKFGRQRISMGAAHSRFVFFTPICVHDISSACCGHSQGNVSVILLALPFPSVAQVFVKRDEARC